MKPTTFLTCLALPLASVAWAGPAVEFTQQEIRIIAKPEQNEVPVDFKFTVKGDAPLVISDLEVTCKCLHASVEKTEFQPGESGVIKTIMDVGAHEGDLAKVVTVHSNDTQSPQRALKATVHIPQLVEFTPPITSWTVGDKTEPKLIKVKVLHEEPINIKKLSCTRAEFTPDIKVITPGREYEITLTPETTANPTLGLLTIETDCKIEKYQKRQAFFRVERKRPTATVRPS
jgi:hypothetical protein